jgi:hypothetical protein
MTVEPKMKIELSVAKIVVGDFSVGPVEATFLVAGYTNETTNETTSFVRGVLRGGAVHVETS